MKALVLAVLALTGCYFKTRDTLVETAVSAPETSTTVVDTGTTEVTAGTQANVLRFRVVTPRECATETTQVFEVVRGKKVDVGVSLWVAPALLVPYVFLAIVPVSGLIALGRVAGHKPEKDAERRVVSRRAFKCAVSVGDAIATVRFPSGAIVEARTDKRGIASVFIPDADEGRGAARIEMANLSRTVDYDKRAYDHEQLAITVDE